MIYSLYYEIAFQMLLPKGYTKFIQRTSILSSKGSYPLNSSTKRNFMDKFAIIKIYKHYCKISKNSLLDHGPITDGHSSFS